MSRNYYYMLLFSALLALTACKKEQTLQADLTVLNAEDGSPVSGAGITYEYVSSSEEHKEEVGTTDQDGKFHFSRKIGKVDTYTKLRIHAAGYENAYTNGFEVDINPGSDNVIEKKLNPCYHFSFSLKNLGCFNETDTIWVHDLYDYQPNALIFTGCVDTTLSFFNQYPYTAWSYLHTKTVSFTVKRNGVVTSSQQQVNMIFNQITPISVVL